MTDNHNISASAQTKKSLPFLLRQWRERYLRNRHLEINLRDESPQSVASKKPDVVLIPREKTRSSLLGFHPQTNPFEQTLREFDHGHHQLSGSTMERYYISFQPQTMADVLGLCDTHFSLYHPHAAVLPWWPAISMHKWQSIDPVLPRLRYKYPSRYGLDGQRDYGCQFHGPVSPGVANLEFARHTRTHQSLRMQGYLPYTHGHLLGQFLLRGDDWVWVCRKGNHRYASLLAIAMDTIPVAYQSGRGDFLVQREGVNTWPNVNNGVFSTKDALQIFDAIFQGRNWTRLR